MLVLYVASIREVRPPLHLDVPPPTVCQDMIETVRFPPLISMGINVVIAELMSFCCWKDDEASGEGAMA